MPGWTEESLKLCIMGHGGILHCCQMETSDKRYGVLFREVGFIQEFYSHDCTNFLERFYGWDPGQDGWRVFSQEISSWASSYWGPVNLDNSVAACWVLAAQKLWHVTSAVGSCWWSRRSRTPQVSLGFIHQSWGPGAHRGIHVQIWEILVPKLCCVKETNNLLLSWESVCIFAL